MVPSAEDLAVFLMAGCYKQCGALRSTALVIGLLLLAASAFAQDELTDYPIKEEQCENFGECLTDCVKKLPANRQFTEIVSVPFRGRPADVCPPDGRK